MYYPILLGDMLATNMLNIITKLRPHQYLHYYPQYQRIMRWGWQ